ncbi:MAG: hypothetical protein MUE69_27370 [Myxococcota bacterium]|jgi:hypothetical protein|nr:hypothetical protein [Myxococcota bacterium]
MDRAWANVRYTSEVRRNDREGWTSLDVHVHAGDESVGALAFRIVFWDAVGQFFVEPLIGEIPLEILEEAAAEAKRAVPVK